MLYYYYLLLLVSHHTILAAPLPKHHIHIRWAVDLQDSLPAPTEKTLVADAPVSNYFLWIGFLTWICFLILLCVCLYPVRRYVWFAIQQRFGFTPNSNGTRFETEMTHATETELDNLVGTASLASEGPNDVQTVQTVWSNFMTLVTILAILAEQECEIGATDLTTHKCE